jgi:hypothetical protein
VGSFVKVKVFKATAKEPQKHPQFTSILSTETGAEARAYRTLVVITMTSQGQWLCLTSHWQI